MTVRGRAKFIALGLLGLVVAGLVSWRVVHPPEPAPEVQGLIGPRVIGPQIGPQIGPRIGAVSSAGNVILLGPGDSNAVGQVVGQAAGVDGEADPAFAIMTPIAGVQYKKRYAQASADPINYLTDVTGAVGPYNVAGIENSGFQVPLAQEMTRAGFAFSLLEHAISGIEAKQWTPSANFPTLPGGTLNLWNQTTALADSFGGRVRGQIQVIGGNDGTNAPDAAACQANLTAIENASIAKWGSNLAIVMVRNSANQAAAVANLATIQAAQDAVAAAFPSNITEVWTDDLALHSDNLHFNGNSAVVLGQRVAYAMLDRLAVARVRPSTFPQVMCWAPLYTSAAGAFSVVGPGCAIDKDLEVMTVFSQTASGANAAIGTPTTTGAQVWTSRGTATSTDGTSTTRMAVFTRPVTAADLATGHGAMPSSTVPNNGNPINGARIFVVRSPNASSTPSVDVIQTSVNNAFQVGLTLAGVTTTAANELIVAIGGGYRTNATDNPVTMSFTNPTNPLNLFGSNRTVVVDFITHAVWAAQLAAAGATGGVTTTYSLATLGAGAVIGIKP